MKRTHVFASILLFTVVGFAQQQPGLNNPQGRAEQTYTRPTDQTYSPPVETGHNWGGWGLLGLLGLGGLLGRRRETTYTRDERTYGQQQRRVG